MNGHDEERFVRAAKDLLDASVADLDGATLSGLARARSRALERRPGRWWLWRPLPLSAMAAAMATAILVFMATLRPDRESGPDMALVADLELVTAEEPVEFFEDIEFYEWLATEGEPAVSDSGLPDLAGLGLGPAAAREPGAGDGTARVSRLI